MGKIEKKRLTDMCQGGLLGLLIGWLCYRSWIACACGLIIIPFFMKYKKQMREKRRKMMLWREFRDASALLYSSAAAGATLEKVLRDTCHDMKISDENYPLLIPEFERICLKLDQNQPIDTVLETFAARSDDEDIACFVRVLTVARKSGGSLAEIIRHTADTMRQRMEMNEEIENILAGKRGEWKVMLIVPPGILLYMNICSSEYMQILYTDFAGRAVMTAALVVYAAAIWIGGRILDIRV